MVEAVGHQYLETYLATLDRLLTDDGQAMLQAITIRDQRFEAAKREMDFIKRYIFPGGFLPSHRALLDGMARRTSLNVLALDEIGPPTRAPCASGATASRPTWSGCASSATTSASSACGATTSATARGASWSAPSAPATCCWPSPGRDRHPRPAGSDGDPCSPPCVSPAAASC